MSTHSEDFRVRWAVHPGLTLLVYTVAEGTPTVDSLELLASWTATAEKTGDPPAY